jgi:hypothetical protein
MMFQERTSLQPKQFEKDQQRIIGQQQVVNKLKNSGWKSPLPVPSRSELARLHSSGIRHADLMQT